MKYETMETPSTASENTEWNKLSKLPFAGENKEGLAEGRFNSQELPLSDNPRLRTAQEKFLRGEPLSMFEKTYDRDGAVITTNIGGYELKSDHAYRVVSSELYDEYVKNGVISRNIDEYIPGQNNGGVDWYLGGAAAATKKYGDGQDDIVVLECPADKEYFSLTSDNGNGMVINPRIRHIKSSSKEHPVPMDKITNVFRINRSGQITTLDNVGVVRARVLDAFRSGGQGGTEGANNKQSDWNDDIDDLWGENLQRETMPTRPNDDSIDADTEKRISREELKDLTARRAADTALNAIRSVAGAGVMEEYRKRMPGGDNASYDELKPVVDEINKVVKQDWENKMTDLKSYHPGDNYKFICQSINEPYKASEYLGNYASCSLLTDENHNTYSTGFGFIYAPEDIVAASDNDINLENRATNDDDVMRLQSIPTIDSVENVLKQQGDRMTNDPINSHRQYNEVGVRAGKPIGIFCLSDGKDGGNPMSNYAMALKLQKLNPELKLAILPKGINSVENQPQPSVVDDLDDDDLVW